MRLLRFLLWFFAVIGILATGVFAAAVAALVWFQELGPSLPDEIHLALRLDGELDEVRDPSVIPALLSGQPRLSVFDIVRTLDAARTDHRVSGLAVDLSQAVLDLAEAGELRSAIMRFRAAGKDATAFAESFDGPDALARYHLATGFDRIALQPSGSFSALGISAAVPLLTGLLEEHGVRAEIDRRHEFKSAMVGLTERDLPDAVRGNLRALIHSQFDRFVAATAAARTLSPQRVRDLIDRAPLSAADALSQGLVDRLAYSDGRLDTRATGDDEPAPAERAGAVDLADYHESLDRPDSDVRIAVIGLAGSIARGDADLPFDNRYRALSGRLADAIRQAREDTSVRGLILRIDSPGGDYVASDAVRDALARFRDSGRSVVVSMSGMAASGAYFVAVEADRILAHPGTVTGSIGIAGGKVSFGDLLARHGVRVARESVGANAAMLSATEPFTPAQSERHALFLDAAYADLVGRVGERRDLGPDALDRAARGRVWSGIDALDVGLVDAIGGFHEAEAMIRDLAGLDAAAPVELVVFPEEPDRLDALRAALVSDGLATTLSRLDDMLRAAGPVLSVLRPLLDSGVGAQPVPSAIGPVPLSR